MILHVNHLQPGVAAAAGETVGSLLALVEAAGPDRDWPPGEWAISASMCRHRTGR